MEKFQKSKQGPTQTPVFRSPDWFKAKAVINKPTAKIKPISFHGTQHRG